MRGKISLLAVLAASAAYAQNDSVIILPEISYSAYFGAVEAGAIGAQLEIFDDTQIKAHKSEPVGSLLATAPSVYVTGNGPIGSQTSFSIRGARQYENKVLIDGIDVGDPSGPQTYFDLGALNMGTMERVEIIKGSQSAIYGANSVGGVISFESFEPEKDGLSGEAGLEYGSYATISSYFSLGHKGAHHRVSLSTSETMSDGFSAADERNGNDEADGFEGRRWSANAEYDFTPSITLGVSGFTDQSATEYDDNYAFTPPYALSDSDARTTRDEMGARAFLRYQTEKQSHEISFSRFETERESGKPNQENKYQGGRDVIGYQGGYQITDALTANWRLENTSESFEASTDWDGDIDAKASNSAAAFGLNYTHANWLDLNLAARMDDHESYGAQNSYRIAAAIHPTDAITLKASYGTGYRAPSLYESNYRATSDLGPESSQSYDLGVEYAQNGIKLGANYFNIQTEDSIEYNDNGTTGYFDAAAGVWVSEDGDDFYENQNLSVSRSGVELYGQYAFNENISLNFGYSNLESENEEGKRLRKIPTEIVTLGADAKFGKFSANVNARMVSDVLDYKYEKLDDYTLVNARLGYTLGRGEIYVRAENLLDEKYQTARDYGTSGEAYYFGYQVEF